ncbi:oxidoreductase [Sphingobacterium siyangense subsp. cladoniae]|uniref:oxidoreductase n=1 Tax=Sphingobacterium siyangense TaxID=459529 RepID=UPI0031F7769C
MRKTWFITGSSRGLGRSITAAVLAKGDNIAATARNPKQLEEFVTQYPDQIIALPVDVTSREQIDKAVKDTIEKFGRIDVLVNNAGVGITGAVEEFSDEQMDSQLHINLHGPIDVTRAVLPYMRKQGSGSIFNISSVGGRVGSAGFSMYQAGKFGLQGFTEVLAQEVSHLGIKVTSIEPGGIRTDWSAGSMTYANVIDDYKKVLQPLKDYLKTIIPMGSPQKAAQVIIDLVEHPEPPVHLLLGSDAVSILEAVETQRKAELEKWKHISISTDYGDVENPWASEETKKQILSMK